MTSPPATEPERWVITGASGFIGAAVVRAITASGGSVLALTRTGSRSQRLHGITGCELLEADELESPAVLAAVTAFAPHTFLHAAWRGVVGGMYDDASQVEWNVPRSLATVRLAARSGCTQWIGLGSQAEYGRRSDAPSEDAPTNPTTTYGAAKVATRWGALAMCDALGLLGSWLRIYSTYGPGDDSRRLLPTLVEAAESGATVDLTGGEQAWDFLHVDDCAGAIIDVARSRAGGVFNVASGASPRLREVVDALVRISGDRINVAHGVRPYGPDGPPHLRADISRLTAATGWVPRIDLQTGLQQLLADHAVPALLE